MKDIVELLRGPLGPLMMGSEKAAQKIELADETLRRALDYLECGRAGDAADMLRGLIK